jgi:hypothetical protein
MKSRQQRQHKGFLTRFAVLIVSVGLTYPTFAAVNVVLDSEAALLRIQRHYALLVGEQVKNLLCAASQEDVELFMSHFLQDKDPVIQKMDYVPEQDATPASLTLTLHSNEKVAALLEGKTLVYEYAPKTLKWKLVEQPEPSTSLVTATSPSGIPDVGMGIIIEYCLNPLGFAVQEGMLPDTTWCCEWQRLAMPSPVETDLQVDCSLKSDDPDEIKIKEEQCDFSFYNQKTGKLKLPRVAVTNEESGEKALFWVELCHQNHNEQSLPFKLCAHKKREEPYEPQLGDTKYNASIDLVEIPKVVDTDNNLYQLKLKPNNDGEFDSEDKIKNQMNSTAREIVQRGYAFMVWQEMKNALARSPSEDQINEFIRQLLLKNPFIQDLKIEYAVADLIVADKEKMTIKIIMRNTEVVEPQLKGEELVYDKRGEQWDFDIPSDRILAQSIKSVATAPSSLLRDVGMSMITEYCDNPQGYRHGDGLPDTEWCPIWLLSVMP